MLKNKSDDFKTLILLKLTKNIIENSSSAGLYKLEKLIKSENLETFKISLPKTKKEIKEQIKKEVKEKLGYSPSVKIKESDSFIVVEKETPKKKKLQQKIPLTQKRIHPPIKPTPRRIMPQIIQKPRRSIPLMQAGADLPQNLQYLKPSKEEIQPIKINLGKLNPFLQDRNVITIESEGPDEDLFVTGTMGKKSTGIKLSKDEIDEIINKFSTESKIPAVEGVFKVLLGHVQLVAMISESLGTRFIIKKIK